MFKNLQFIESMRGAAFCFMACYFSAGGIINAYKKGVDGVDAVDAVDIEKRIAAFETLRGLYFVAIKDYGALCQPKNGIVTPESVEKFIKTEAAICRAILAILDAYSIENFETLSGIADLLRFDFFDNAPLLRKKEVNFFDDLKAWVGARQIETFAELEERAAK